MCKALLCHALSINMEWTTTAKELEASGFRVGLDRIVRDFKWMVRIDLVRGNKAQNTSLTSSNSMHSLSP
jgi:hypothetical protein